MGVSAKRKQELQSNKGEMGPADSLKYNVVFHVVREEYERAIDELEKFRDQDFEYPKLSSRISGYICHAIDLVNAVRSKRSFPGFKNLPAAKQKDLSEKYQLHFDDLQVTLDHIEKIQLDESMEDIRATVWVVKTAAIAVAVVCGVAFALEISNNLLGTVIAVIDEGFSSISDWILRF